MDDLERILSSEPMIDPAPGFTAQVMEAVRREAEAPPALAFPWWRAGIGGAAMALLLGVAIIALPQQAEPAWLPAVTGALDVVSRILSKAGAPLIAALLISLVSARLSLRATG